MRCRTDVIAPAVFRRGQSTKHVRRLVAIQQRDHTQGVRVRVGEGAVRELLADEGTDRIGATRAVPLLDPAVEEGEQFGFERDPEAHNLDGHGPDPEVGPLVSLVEKAGFVGAKPMSS